MNVRPESGKTLIPYLGLHAQGSLQGHAGSMERTDDDGWTGICLEDLEKPAVKPEKPCL